MVVGAVVPIVRTARIMLKSFIVPFKAILGLMRIALALGCN